MNKCNGCLFLGVFHDMGASTPLCTRGNKGLVEAVQAHLNPKPCKWHITKKQVEQLQEQTGRRSGMNSNIQLGPGRLFIEGPDGPECLGSVYELEAVDSTFEEEPWPKENPVIQRVATEVLTCSIKMVGQAAQRALDALLGVTKAMLELCPDKRVVHLAKHARKERTRKKNRRRAYRLLAKEAQLNE